MSKSSRASFPLLVSIHQADSLPADDDHQTHDDQQPIALNPSPPETEEISSPASPPVPPAPAPVSLATANPLESKLAQLLDVMTLFVQGQM